MFVAAVLCLGVALRVDDDDCSDKRSSLVARVEASADPVVATPVVAATPVVSATPVAATPVAPAPRFDCRGRTADVPDSWCQQDCALKVGTYPEHCEWKYASRGAKCVPAEKLRLGGPGEALIPNLVFGHDCTYVNRETVGIRDIAVWYHDTNRYSVSDKETDTVLFNTQTEFQDSQWYYRTIHVYQGGEGSEILFNVRSTHWVWNPLNPFNRYSYRVMPPSKDYVEDDDEAMYTINKGWSSFSTNIMNDHWYIWKGREGHGKCLYRAVENFMSTNVTIYKGCGSLPLLGDAPGRIVGSVERMYGYDLGWAFDTAPDRYNINVKEGEDAGLFLTLMMVMDVSDDHRTSAPVSPKASSRKNTQDAGKEGSFENGHFVHHGQ